jgi:hypothetical protein
MEGLGRRELYMDSSVFWRAVIDLQNGKEDRERGLATR